MHSYCIACCTTWLFLDCLTKNNPSTPLNDKNEFYAKKAVDPAGSEMILQSWHMVQHEVRTWLYSNNIMHLNASRPDAITTGMSEHWAPLWGVKTGTIVITVLDENYPPPPPSLHSIPHKKKELTANLRWRQHPVEGGYALARKETIDYLQLHCSHSDAKKDVRATVRQFTTALTRSTIPSKDFKWDTNVDIIGAMSSADKRRASAGCDSEALPALWISTLPHRCTTNALLSIGLSATRAQYTISNNY